jgi:hypothetical protein
LLGNNPPQTTGHIITIAFAMITPQAIRPMAL